MTVLTLFSADQDKAMEVAIAKVFPDIIHRICRWHVVNKVTSSLNELYVLHERRNFKGKFQSVLNHPLTPGEFEAAWKDLICEFDLHNHPSMESLYQQRRNFIPAYFKKDYCGRMTSTQRSESTNYILKKGFVDKGNALHRFAKNIMNFMHSRLMKEAEETYLSTVKYNLKFRCVRHNSSSITLTV